MKVFTSKNSILKGVFWISVFLAFYFVFKFLYCKLWFSTFTLSKEIVPVDVLSLLTSIVIAFIFGYYISKRFTEERFLKELIIKDIFLVEDEITYFERVITESKEVKLDSAFSALHKLKIKIERFEKTAELLGIKCKEISKLTELHSELYKMSTDTDDGTIFTDSQNESIKVICNNLVINLRKIIYIINKKRLDLSKSSNVNSPY